MAKLYSREGNDFEPAILDILYVLKTGHIIESAPVGETPWTSPGVDLEIKEGRWAVGRFSLTAEFSGELADSNVKVDREKLELIGERKYSEEKPTLTAIAAIDPIEVIK